MALINPEKIYHLDSITGVTELPGGCTMLNSGILDEQLDYYYLQFKDGESFGNIMLHTLIPHDLLGKIRDLDSNVYLVLSNAHEAFHSVIDCIYKFVVIAHHVPPEKIILWTGSFDIVEEIDVVAQKYKRAPIKAELTVDFEKTTVDYLEHYEDVHGKPFNKPATLTKSHYDKVYLNFNRRWRPSRPTFVGLLCARSLLDRGYVSLAPSDCGHRWPESWHSLVDMNYAFPDLVNLLRKHKEEIINLPPMYLDTDDLVTNRAELLDDTAHLYADTMVSLVAETNFYTCHTGYEPSRFLSEKTFKPIVFEHPFIFISTPRLLSALRQIGYQTFDGIIDESYDQIDNDGDRMLAILDETERLCSFTDSQVAEYCGRAKEVCAYNYRTLRAKTKFSHKLNF